jgi:hypothetical protein
VDLRYGVLVDIARKVFAGEAVDVTMGYFNCIWQGDANDMILRAMGLAQSPPLTLNLTGPKSLSVREVAFQFGRLMNRPAKTIGREAATALLSDSSAACRLLGPPPTALEQVIHWTADWIKRGSRILDKPTHFEARDGIF